MMDRLLHDSRFDDFLAMLTGGSSGHDHLNGTESGNVLFAGRGADAVSGMAGNDMLSGWQWRRQDLGWLR
jgi:Ca2+-binding RTX toxin-like protein